MGGAESQAAEGVSAEDIRKALELLRLIWGDLYDIGFDAERGRWWASRRGVVGHLRTAGSPGELGLVLGNDFGITLETVRETFTEWRVWERDGWYLALRSGSVTAQGPMSLIVPFVSAPTPAALADHLSMQEWLRRMSAAELKAVWLDGFPEVRA